MLSIKNAKKLLPVLAALLIAVLSVFVLTDKIPQLSFITQSLDSLEQSNQTVLRFTGSTMAASVAITALPDDFATPLASTLADINKYFVVILIAIFVERLILVEGIRLSLTYLIPAACILWAAARLLNNPTIRNFALRIVILGLAVILVVPCSTHFVDAVCSDYLQYVEDTIEETDAGAGKINEVMNSEGEEPFFDRLTAALKTALQGVNDLLNYFKNILKKCITSVAILILTNFVIPVAVMLLFLWLFKELFHIQFSMPAPPVKQAASSFAPVKQEAQDEQ